MEMQVGHRLPCLLAAVVHYAVALPAVLGADSCDDLKDMSDEGEVFRRDLARGGNMLLGNHQKVDRCLRVKVVKGKHLFVLVQLVCGDLSRCDLTEYTHEEGLLSVGNGEIQGGSAGGNVRQEGAAEGERSLPEAPAGRLLYDEIVLLPVKGSDAAGGGLHGGAP